MKKFKMITGFIGCAVLIAPSIALALSSQPIFNLNLQHMVAPVRFPLDNPGNLRPGSLQARMIQLTQALRAACAKSALSDEKIKLACTWPAVVEEVNTTGTALKKDNPSEDAMALTLAARVHRVDLLEYSNVSVPFDLAYARFLISLRTAREIWPSVRESIPKLGLKSETMDVFIEAWLTTLTPWSMIYQMSVNKVCSDFSTCMDSQDLARSLAEAMRRIRGDKEFIESVKLQMQSLRANDEIMGGRRSALLDKKLTELIDAVLNNKPSGYLFERTSYIYTTATAAEITSFLREDVPAISHQLQLHDYLPSGEPCRDSRRILAFLKEDPSMSWSLKAPALSCANAQIAEEESELLADWLRTNRKLRLFNLFHLRIVLMNVFEPVNETEVKALRLAQLQRLFADVNNVWDSMDKYNKGISLRNDGQVEGREMLRLVYNFLLDLVDNQMSGDTHGK